MLYRWNGVPHFAQTLTSLDWFNEKLAGNQHRTLWINPQQRGQGTQISQIPATTSGFFQ